MRLQRLLPLLLLALATPAHADPYEVAALAGSVVEYEIRDGTGTIVATAPLASFTLRFDDDDVRGTEVRAVMNLDRFSSGNLLRDTNARRTVFEVRDFPIATFAGLSLDADPFDLPEGATRTLSVLGVLDLHGVEREVMVPLEVVRSGGRLRIAGRFELLLSDHGMQRPAFLFLEVEDRVVVRLRLEVELTPASP